MEENRSIQRLRFLSRGSPPNPQRGAAARLKILEFYPVKASLQWNETGDHLSAVCTVVGDYLLIVNLQYGPIVGFHLKLIESIGGDIEVALKDNRIVRLPAKLLQVQRGGIASTRASAFLEVRSAGERPI